MMINPEVPQPWKVSEKPLGRAFSSLVKVFLAIAAVIFCGKGDSQILGGGTRSTGEPFAQAAIDIVVSDLQREVLAGSTLLTPSPGQNVCQPNAPAVMIPYRVGANGAGLDNLLKRSVYAQPFYAGANYDTNAYPAPARAAGVSTTAASLDGRAVSAHRWNRPLLLKKQDNASDTDLRPVAGFAPPDWTLVARDGSNPTAWNPNLINSPTASTSVLARYAYNIYDEGGLLDANLAGYPSGTPAGETTYKKTLADADLSRLGLSQAQIDALITARSAFLFGSRQQLIDLFTQTIAGNSQERAALQSALS